MFFNKKKYKISLKGRSGVVYSEGDRMAKIEAEIMTGKTDLVIYFDSLSSWQLPNENILLTDDDRQRSKREHFK